jgi:hypothetical protein
MKRALVVVVSLLLVLPGAEGLGTALAQSTPARSYGSPIAQVNTVPIQPNGVTTTMFFQALGSPGQAGTRITGTAFGFDWRLSGRYYSLVYDLQSVSPQDPGAVAPFCKKNNDTIPFLIMIIGMWVVDPFGFAILVQLPTNLTQLQLNLARTASVRFDTQFGSPIPPAPDPTRFLLRSCGSLYTPPGA